MFFPKFHENRRKYGENIQNNTLMNFSLHAGYSRFFCFLIIFFSKIVAYHYSLPANVLSQFDQSICLNNQRTTLHPCINIYHKFPKLTIVFTAYLLNHGEISEDYLMRKFDRIFKIFKIWKFGILRPSYSKII